jgi:hypothetical protein
MTEASQVVGDYESENPGAFGEKSPVAQTYALFNMAFAGGQLLGPILAGGLRVRAGCYDSRVGSTVCRDSRAYWSV